MQTNEGQDTTTTIAANLPYLRRYARALTGSQTTGDRYAAATLEAILAGIGDL
ncbi:MAG: response regulator, partial [Paracoccaceae bacterium]